MVQLPRGVRVDAVWRMFFNTVLYAGCVTAGQVFFFRWVGCAFARPVPGPRYVVRLVLEHFDGAVGYDRHPIKFILMRDRVDAVGDDRAGLFGSAFGTYLMRQFFRTLPTDLEWSLLRRLLAVASTGGFCCRITSRGAGAGCKLPGQRGTTLCGRC